MNNIESSSELDDCVVDVCSNCGNKCVWTGTRWDCGRTCHDSVEAPIRASRSEDGFCSYCGRRGVDICTDCHEF